MKKKVRRVGSGRTKGAVSFVTVTLNDLNDVLKPEANVLISRRFAENLGIGGTPVTASTKNVEALSSKIEIKETELDAYIGLTTTEW